MMDQAVLLGNTRLECAVELRELAEELRGRNRDRALSRESLSETDMRVVEDVDLASPDEARMDLRSRAVVVVN